MAMKGVAVVICFIIVLKCEAQFQINGFDSITLDFSNVLNNVSNGFYNGSGFHYSPATLTVITEQKYLDSDAFAIAGTVDWEIDYGEFDLLPPLAHGSNSHPFNDNVNPIVDPGIYAFNTGIFDPDAGFENPALLIQTNATEMNPGTITIRAVNVHAFDTIDELIIIYDLWYKNNKPTSISWKFSWSLDNVTFFELPSLTFNTPDSSDAFGIEHAGVFTATISDINILPSDYFYARFTIEENSGIGTGEFDEFYLDEITFIAPFLLPITLTHFSATTLTDNTVDLKWTTSSEINSDHFIIERKMGFAFFVPIAEIPAAGNSIEILTYNYIDQYPANGTNYYRLKEVDYDGSVQYSKIVAAEVLLENNTLHVYPNPAKDILYLSGILFYTETDIIIYDVNGKLVTQPLLENNSLQISHLQKGTFIITVINPDAVYYSLFVKDE